MPAVAESSANDLRLGRGPAGIPASPSRARGSAGKRAVTAALV